MQRPKKSERLIIIANVDINVNCLIHISKPKHWGKTEAMAALYAKQHISRLELRTGAIESVSFRDKRLLFCNLEFK